MADSVAVDMSVSGLMPVSTVETCTHRMPITLMG